ncbi:hypothetical protein AB1K54_03535 [Microbacterium sp. BWT-B31]|uniref:FMN-binding protein n=1 Tax=Microbacterium sp. BWT-B31 TaxID=3232072 RepID=UPI003529C91C
MIRTMQRPALRLGALVGVGVAGALGLSACSPAGTSAEADAPDMATGAPDAPTGASQAPDAGAGSGSSDFADGTYSAQGAYATPETVETIEVTVTLADGVITAVEVAGSPQRPETERYQGEFIAGISDEVVGRPIDEISVSRVAGSSLTSGGFNQAIEAIKSEAAS